MGPEHSIGEPAPVGRTPRLGPLQWLISRGVRVYDPRSVARRTRQVNAAATVAVLSMMPFVVLNLAVASSSTRRAVWLALPFLGLLSGVPLLNQWGYRSTARWLAIVASTGALLVNAAYVGGGASGIHALFPVVALASATVFSRRESLQAGAVLLVQVALFLHFELFARSGSADFEALDAGLRTSIRAALVLVAVIVALGVVGYAEACARANEQELARVASSDPLTGLPNRVALELRLAHAARQAQQFGEFAAVLFLDLDGFKPVNDAHGHRTGDRLLVSVARRLTATVRDVDVAARVGGDEFVVVLLRLGHDLPVAELRAKMVAGRIEAALREAHSVSDERGRPTDLACPASVGVALLRPGDSPAEVIGRADLAMYEAKRGERRVVFAGGEAHASG